MSMRLAGLLTPAALLFTIGTAPAQHHGGGGHMGGGHMGGMHMGGLHYGGTHMGGMHYGGGGGYHHGGYHNGGYYGSGYYGGLGYGLGGLGYYGGLGYGLGSMGYGYGLGGLGYGLGGLGGYGGYPNYGGGYSYGPAANNYYLTPTAPAVPSIPAAAVNPGYVPQTSSVLPAGTPGAATISVIVPDGAEVWFNGQETGKVGGTQVFTSPKMQPGESATLSIKAQWGGTPRQMQIPIRAGDKMSIDLRNQ